jgi:hypothetical protein
MADHHDNRSPTKTGAALARELVSLAKEITGELDAARLAFRAGLEHAIKAGELLVRVKPMLPHGSFTSWVQENCGLKKRTADGYMDLYRNRDLLSGDMSIREALMLLTGHRKAMRPASTVTQADREIVQRQIASSRKDIGLPKGQHVAPLPGADQGEPAPASSTPAPATEPAPAPATEEPAPALEEPAPTTTATVLEREPVEPDLDAAQAVVARWLPAAHVDDVAEWVERAFGARAMVEALEAWLRAQTEFDSWAAAVEGTEVASEVLEQDVDQALEQALDADQIRAGIRTLMEDGKPQIWLADKADVSRPTLRKLLRGEPVSPAILTKLAAFLQQ